MARVKLDRPVMGLDGVTTCAELLDDGKAWVSKSDIWRSRTSKTGMRTAYFCDLIDASGIEQGSFEISRYAYGSRLAKGQDRESVQARMGAVVEAQKDTTAQFQEWMNEGRLEWIGHTRQWCSKCMQLVIPVLMDKEYCICPDCLVWTCQDCPFEGDPDRPCDGCDHGLHYRGQ